MVYEADPGDIAPPELLDGVVLEKLDKSRSHPKTSRLRRIESIIAHLSLLNWEIGHADFNFFID